MYTLRNFPQWEILSRIAIGADLCYSARSMMFALGCIQALRCNSNHCPTGVATQSPKFYNGLDVADKRVRVANFHHKTLESVSEILGAMGFDSPSKIKPWHLFRRTGINQVVHYNKLYEYLSPGDLLKTDIPKSFEWAFKAATANSFYSTFQV